MKSSLYAKVFFITSIMLLFVSLLVFGLLAWLMPQTYSNRLNIILDERTQEFIAELEQVPFSESGGLFDQFIANTEINSVELYNSGGDWITLPTKEFDNEWEGNIAQTAVTGLGEISPVLSNQYYFSFSDCSDRYTLVVYGEAEQISELQQSFIRVFPIILLLVLAIALVVSWLYSHMITKPVLEISRISEKMSDLQLDWTVDEQRTDELGTLGKSLHRLSRNLSCRAPGRCILTKSIISRPRCIRELLS